MRYYVITSDLAYEVTKETAEKIRKVYPQSVVDDNGLREYLTARRQKMIYG